MVLDLLVIWSFQCTNFTMKHVVQNTLTDLRIHGEIFDMMGLERTPYNKINIHCNGVYGDKQSADG